MQKVYMNVDNGYDLINLPSSTLAQPLAIDFYGNFTISLFGQSKETSGFSLWTVTDKGAHVSKLDVFKGCVLTDPHANAWVDLNGDCKAGIIILISKLRLAFIL